jgi:hypothetical protein
MRLRRMLSLRLCLAILPDWPDGYGPVVACRDSRSGGHGRLSNQG